jgi:serine protease DegS
MDATMGSYFRYLLLPALIGAAVGYAALSLHGATFGQSQASSSLSYADAVELAAQSVVNIYSTKIVHERTHPICEIPRYEPLCESFFGPTRRMQNSLGSGVIARADGYILTNAHVIAGADEILVAFNDGGTAKASIVGIDPETDLAVIKVEASNLEPVLAGSSDAARVGDVVLAIGNPFGIGQAVSKGIISAKGRTGISSSPYEDFIQTDAAINPGSSGGALIDTQGRLIGVNSLIYSQNGGSQGIGFAIPATLAFNVFEEIVREGRVIRGFLGIEISNLTEAPAGVGLAISNVLINSPAAHAGVRPGDVIVAINGQPAVNPRVVVRQIALTEPGSDIQLDLVRNGEKFELRAVSGVRPSLN